MATGTTIAGKGSVRIAGKIYNCLKIDPNIGTEKREKLVGLGGVVNGDKVTLQAPSLAITVIVEPNVNVTTLNAIQNELISVSMADGRRYLFGGASTAEPGVHSATDGTMDVTFTCATGLEV